MGTDTDAAWEPTYRRDCPSRTVVELLANKWSLYVLAALRRNDGPMRFNELRRLLDDVTQKMLSQTLRSLERAGLVSRTVHPTVPPRVDYALTRLGRDAGVLTTALGEWSVGNAHRIAQARADYDARAADIARTAAGEPSHTRTVAPATDTP